MVDVGALGTSDSHHTEIVLRKLFLKSTESLVDNFGRLFIEVMFILSIKLVYSVWFIHYLILEVSYNLLEFVDMCSSGFRKVVANFITFVLTPTHIVDLLRRLLIIGLANLVYCL